jgi:hypothetical protein
MIIVAGDFHGSWGKVNQLIAKKPNIDTIFQCGDFGWWPKFHRIPDETSRSTYGRRPKSWDQFGLKNNKVKIYFIDGNHEDHESIEEKVSKGEIEFMPNVFYMKRGSTMLLPDGRNILFIGGADSVDKKLRTPGHDWFPQETISYKTLMILPDEKVDIIISHTAPNYFNIYKAVEESMDSRTALDYVFDKYQPSRWYFGHFHSYKEGTFKDCKWTALSHVESMQRWWIELD